VLTYSIPESKRHLRRKLRRRLQWLGFGDLNHSTWIAPRDLQADVKHMVNALGVSHYVEYFAGAHRGFSNGEEILAHCWNLKQLHRYYADLIARYEPLYKAYMSRMESNTGPDPEECFIQRFLLIHEYRSSPYVDPNLPLELLPDDWLGGRATELFQLLRGLLTGGAEAFVDEVFAKAPTSSDV
jgi:phenylacetic acid degradation operon negative regulatory protein